ncbi:Indigoidine synthase A like protein-domain-containing protein [Podospora didyma]|uniref:Indigoidine synthase A like protein-domain-containing protein n=1 Tax=Podospora didyma TaxID=330526 RepID=A0AAE0U8E3_9PEZI|nr:Indigoidine synthase A like protein-domain-containing protein [Podospora didyma]
MTTQLRSGLTLCRLLSRVRPSSSSRCLGLQTPLKTDLHRFYSATSLAGLKGLLDIRPEVADAVATNKPLVALESTIYTHGGLGDDLPANLENIVREHGAVPAVIGILAGVPTVGLTSAEIKVMTDEGACKVSRRDIAYLVGKGLRGEKTHGGTTISGTMIMAKLAGIRVFGTGGLGGVHRGGADSMDISADLTELGRTRVAVISSGCKGFLDIPRTLEFLETQGALVATFADGRKSNIDFPAFWSRDSGTKSPAVVQDEYDAASIIFAQEKLGIESGMFFANPIPEEFSIPRQVLEEAIETATREAAERGFTGSSNTPFVLQRMKQLIGSKSALSNISLVQGNVAMAAKVAVELSKLLEAQPDSPKTDFPIQVPSFPTAEKQQLEPVTTEQGTREVGILVAGSVALDLSCDFVGGVSAGSIHAVSPALHTSNPASINQSVGGVGHNVALAAHRVSGDGKVRLCSMVGDDIAGSTICSALELSGLDTSSIRKLGHEYPLSRTAQYVAVNDAEKNLVMAMADMAIFSQHSFPTYWNSAVKAAKPKWLVVDGNWAEGDVHTWIEAGRKHNARVAYEPVSTAKSQRLFAPLKKEGSRLGIFPHASVDLTTPNQYELAAMYDAAKGNDYFEAPGWFEVIDAFGMMGARDKFVRITSPAMTDAGIPVQTVQLLPYIPTIVTKMGANGALLTTILSRGDPRLRDPSESSYILTRSLNDHPHVGGIYMRLFPAIERVKDIVSVNGVGDTFMGVLIAGLAQGGKIENLINVAQKAAVLTLKSHESVSTELVGLKNELKIASSL